MRSASNGISIETIDKVFTEMAWTWTVLSWKFPNTMGIDFRIKVSIYINIVLAFSVRFGSLNKAVAIGLSCGFDYIWASNPAAFG